ncbi:STAS domain-containing protein [Mongoliimonas terrestris]|uniref:STAS domain-containing protein n=1 Tax=Mongoliimonas terrestris TaxID=1709001 RepID=UPI000B077416|nr:STAS domain-containing protein [Mongoliimonas terrestris]
MQIVERHHNAVLVIRPTGRLDSSNAPLLDQHLSATIDRGDTIFVIDLSTLDYISSIGLSVLLSAAKKVKRAEGRVALAALNERVRTVMEISGFIRIFDIYPSVEAATVSP